MLLYWMKGHTLIAIHCDNTDTAACVFLVRRVGSENPRKPSSGYADLHSMYFTTLYSPYGYPDVSGGM